MPLRSLITEMPLRSLVTEFPYGNAVTDCIYDGKETPSAVLFVLLVSTREYYRMVKEFLRKIFFRPIVLKKYDEISEILSYFLSTMGLKKFFVKILLPFDSTHEY